MLTYLTKIDMDNGSFPLAKDALKALIKTKISGSHRAIIDVIWLETYAWHDENSEHEAKIKKRRTHARIPYQVFTDETWMDKSFISRKLNELVNWGIIIRDKNTSPYTYCFNVYVDRWDKKIFRNTTIYRSINNSQDSKLFTEQSTNSLPDSQLEVDRIVNSLPLEMPNNSGIDRPLKKDKESIKRKKKKSDLDQDKVPYQKIVDLFHERCPSYPRVIKITENRKTHIQARWNQHRGKIEVFTQVFKKAETSTFMKGSNERCWCADFDWIMNENNMIKILEGKYDNNSKRGSPKTAKYKPVMNESQSPASILAGQCEIYVPPKTDK